MISMPDSILPKKWRVQHWNSLSLKQLSLKVYFFHLALTLALRLHPAILGSLPWEVPKEGMMIAGQYIESGRGEYPDVCHHARRSSFLKPPFIYSNALDWRWKGPGNLYMAHEVASENHPSFTINSNVSLALMVIKMVVVIFVWYFDAEFVEDRQREPSYEDAFIVVQVYAYQFP